MKFKCLYEAKSIYRDIGSVEFYATYEDPVTVVDEPEGLHDVDIWAVGSFPRAMIYKFEDGTRIYHYLQPVSEGKFNSKLVIKDKEGKLHYYEGYKDGNRNPEFHQEFGHYIDGITGAYDTKEFGPVEMKEFREVFSAGKSQF